MPLGASRRPPPVVGSVQDAAPATLAGNILQLPRRPPDTVAGPSQHSVRRWRFTGLPCVRQRLVADSFEGNRKIDLAPAGSQRPVVIPLPRRGRAPSRFRRIKPRRRGVDLASATSACTITKAGRGDLRLRRRRPRAPARRAGRKPAFLADPTAGKEDRARAIAGLIAAATPISDIRASARYRMAMLAVMAERSLLRARNRLQEAMNG